MSEEYSLMSPNTLEAQGLINQSEYQKVASLTHSASPDAQKKLVGKCFPDRRHLIVPSVNRKANDSNISTFL